MAQNTQTHPIYPRSPILRAILKLTHLKLLQPLLSAAWDAVIKAVQMFPIIMIVRPTAQITIIITAAIWIALKQITTIAVKHPRSLIIRTITKRAHLKLLQPLLSAAWGAVIKAVQMFPIIMIVRPTAQIMIIIIPAIWIALKQITTIAVKQLEAIMANTTMIAIIMKVDKGNGVK